ncbi:MAG TPA: hypothetical protein VFF52_06445 [Isosphaeraceae bacterium]|nr:hypothetical protein [Isosphaeraceae bacterium]
MSIVMDLPTLESLRDEQRALRVQLARLRRRLWVQLALEFAADAVVALTATAAVLVFLDWWSRFSLPVRLLLLGLSLVGIVAFLGVRAARRWRSSRLDELSLAVTLDRYRPGVGQQVADVLQLPDLLSEPRASASPAMVRLAVRQACAALAGSDWRSLWNRRRTALHAAALLLGLLVPAVFGWWAPEAARLSAARWLLGSSERWPQQTYLTVMGLDARGRLLAPRDERFVMEVRSDLPRLEPRGDRWVVRGRDEPLTLRRKPAQPQAPEAVMVRERAAEGTIRSGTMVGADPVRFQYEFPPASSSSTFELTGGDDWLGPLTLERVDRPALAETRLRVKEPGATYQGFRNVEDTRQHLLFLPDTEVELTLVGNEPLADTQLKVHPGNPPELKRNDDRTFTARWTLREATTLEILLTSAKTGLASRPAFLSIGLLRDREPRVTLRAVGVGNHVTAVATVPLTIAATDDFGLAALRLQVERTTIIEEKEKPETKVQRATTALPMPSDPAHPVLDHQVRHDVFLQADPPKAGTVLRLTAEAEDRCARGAQTGRSSVLVLQVVTPDELFYEILIRQRAERAKFLAALEAADQQTPVLAGQPTADNYLAVMRILHTGARQLDQIAGRIADTLQEMKLNQIGSPKSHRLLQDGVIDPMRALIAGEMSQLRNVLQTLAGAGSTPGATREAARRLHAEVVTKMKNILDQMSQWESFVDVVNQVAEVIKMEHKVLQDTEKARESRTQEVFDDKP